MGQGRAEYIWGDVPDSRGTRSSKGCPMIKAPWLQPAMLRNPVHTKLWEYITVCGEMRKSAFFLFEK